MNKYKKMYELYFIGKAVIMLFVNYVIFLYKFNIVIQSLGKLDQGDIC